MLIAGEVHTGLLRGPAPVTVDQAAHLADLVVGEPVLVSERPIAYVRSPAVPVGVDCPLVPPGKGRHVRGIGTVQHRAAITGGHLVQGSAYAVVEPARGTARQPWSHYLARPGVVEAVGRVRAPDLAAALVHPYPGTLDLTSIAARVLDRVQDRAGAGTGPLRARGTRLRWTVETGEEGVRFFLFKNDRRLVRITSPEADPARAAALCEDIALHDWLVTTLLEALRKAALGVLPREVALGRLLPVIDCLLHLWMPAARGDDLAVRVWAMLEARPGFSRQWETTVHRIRDQLSAGSVAAPSAAGVLR